MRAKYRFWSACGLVALTAALSIPAAASDWPSRAVKIISPVAAGGTSDTLARILARHFGDMFNQKFFVENRVGGGGLIGSAAVASAEPDGYTLLASNVGYVVIAPALAEKPPFDTMRDLTHIAYLGGPPNVFIAHPSLGITGMKDFVAFAKKQDMVDYVSPGLGTLGNLMAERFATTAGFKLQHIPSKGGGSAITDVVSGTVKFGSLAYTSALGQIRAGTVIPLAVSSNERMPEFPNVPTLNELGYSEFVDTVWFGLAGPAGMDRSVVDRLNKATAQVLQMPEVRDRLLADGVEIRPMTSTEFTSFVGREIEKWGPLARAARKN
jgi:tripartite-type tricarboxylate transporter receptor subunit TctC